MSRILSGESPAALRSRVSKAIKLALRELINQSNSNKDSNKDLIAFIILSLKSMTDSIDNTVRAWEKRNFWLKADKFRSEWSWTATIEKELLKEFNEENWKEIENLTAKLNVKLKNIEVSDKHRMGKPWTDAYKVLQTIYNNYQ